MEDVKPTDRNCKTLCCSLVTASLCLGVLVVSCSVVAFFAFVLGYLLGVDFNHVRHVAGIKGGEVTLNCSLNFPKGKRIPYLVQWRKVTNVSTPILIGSHYPPYRSKMTSNPRIFLENGSASLTITNISNDDQGLYECKVIFIQDIPSGLSSLDDSLNHVNHKNGTLVHLAVLTCPKEESRNPSLPKVDLSNNVTNQVVAYAGWTVILPCPMEVLHSIPNVTYSVEWKKLSSGKIMWTRKDTPNRYTIESTPSTYFNDEFTNLTKNLQAVEDLMERTSLINGSASLKLTNVTSVGVSDEGRYECTVTYFANNTTFAVSNTSIYLKVINPPEPPSYRVSATLGGNVTLPCPLISPGNLSTPYFVQWEKKGKNTPFSLLSFKSFVGGNYSYINKDFVGRASLAPWSLSLKLTNIKDSDHGWYEVRVVFSRSMHDDKNYDKCAKFSYSRWVCLEVGDVNRCRFSSYRLLA